jgi:hypothetical protein
MKKDPVEVVKELRQELAMFDYLLPGYSLPQLPAKRSWFGPVR